jgi:hypothetical protein
LYQAGVAPAYPPSAIGATCWLPFGNRLVTLDVSAPVLTAVIKNFSSALFTFVCYFRAKA